MRLGAQRRARIAAAVAALAVIPAALAGPAPESLRVAKSSGSIWLSWDAGTSPYAIYRSTDPSNVADRFGFVDLTLDLTYADPLEPLTAPLHFYLVGDPLPCTGDPDCDDGDACDGTETCMPFQKICLAGTPVFCNDADPCTTDTCDPGSGNCDFTTLSCDDGDSCTLDSCAAPGGCTHTVDPAAGVGIPAQLAGNDLAQYPYFEYVRAFNEDDPVRLAVDPTVHPDIAGETCDVYVLEARSAGGWCNDTSLTDVRGAPDVRSFTGGTIQTNAFDLIAPLALPSDAGTGLGRGYDVVLDCNANGFLDSTELVDGLSDEAGLYLIHDLTQSGPLAVSSFDEIGPAPDWCVSFPAGGLDDMRIYYPAELDDPGFIGEFPLVVISHGNGHCFDWYDFLGNHLASYGFIVMSHDNETAPGIETASTTTLEFTDRVLAEQGTLGGGVLNGHIDPRQIAWIGHSRGGEGVVRAYDRLVDEAYPAANYTAGDIHVILSIAPTDFLGTTQADPHDANYHLLYGSSDGDVCGCPGSLYPFALYERASGVRDSTYVQGADHNDFNCCGFNDFAGPPATEIGRAEAQQVQKADTLAVLQRYVRGNIPAKDHLWRQYESFRPIGVDPATIVVREYREAPAGRRFVIEDYQSESSTGTSSSGEAVTFDVANLIEDLLIDADGTYAWAAGDPMNGMSRAEPTDSTRGAVFDYSSPADRFLEFEVAPGERDFSDDAYLSFRAAQGTRHPETIATLATLTFTVTLLDGSGGSSSINIGAYGGGIEEPYQRGGGGQGTGWQNEFETIRIRLTDFLHNGSGLDLGDVRFVRFEFGTSFGSVEGRLGFDDVELTEE